MPEITRTLWEAQTTDGPSLIFQHNGGPQGVYVLGVLGGGEIVLESKLPAPSLDTWVPVLNGEFTEANMPETTYTVGVTPAKGLLKIMTSTPGMYRLRLTGSVGATVWAYMVAS